MFNFLPKDTVFFDLFEGLANHVVSVCTHLRKAAHDYPDVGNAVIRIREEEKHADDLAHRTLERLDRTFITPFDREDIHTLVGELDDIVDIVDALAKRFKLYHIDKIENEFCKQADVLLRAAIALREAVCRLRKSRKLTDLSDKLIEVHHMENEGDDNNNTAVSRLFDGSHEPLYVMKWKELYDLIENAIDGCEDACNTLERIVLKNG